MGGQVLRGLPSTQLGVDARQLQRHERRLEPAGLDLSLPPIVRPRPAQEARRARAASSRIGEGEARLGACHAMIVVARKIKRKAPRGVVVGLPIRLMAAGSRP